MKTPRKGSIRITPEALEDCKHILILIGFKECKMERKRTKRGIHIITGYSFMFDEIGDNDTPPEYNLYGEKRISNDNNELTLTVKVLKV